jgi:predicted nucleic acid-binding Zn ribbon protein
LGRAEGPGGSRRRPARSDEALALGAILEGLAAERPWAAGMALGTLGERWPEVVGERLAAECSPVSLEGGSLVVRASSAPWAAQIRFLAQVVRDRANEVLGEGQVSDVRVVVGTR